MKNAWKKFWSLQWKVKGPILGVVAIIIIAAAASGGAEEEPVTASVDDETPSAAANTPEPTETPEPTNTPEPTATPEPTVDTVAAAEVAYRLAMATELRTFSELSTAFGQLTSGGGDLTNPAWRDDTNEAADNVIESARKLRDMRPPSPKYEPYDTKLDEAMEAMVESLVLFKSGLQANNSDVILQAVARMTTANQTFNEAVALIPAAP